jgi:ATP-dependent RNA helicase RhlE
LSAFASLGLATPILEALAAAGYTQPTPIQQQAIPHIMAGGDVMAAAQTGTGKTAGFTLPVLHRLAQQGPSKRPGRPRCLILTPTRELAAQVEESVRTYGKGLPLRTLVMFGGVNINPQITALRQPVDILVATPGRLLDHAGQKTIDLSGVEMLVLDEADRMLDMGFIRDIKRILALLPRERQNLLFSATFSDEIRTLAQGLLRAPKLIEVSPRNTTTELVDQLVYKLPQAAKRDALSHLIREGGWYQVLIFTRTKHGANRLAEKLAKDGIPAAAIHGNKSQSARTRALADFKANKLVALVATDIAARGLDIDQLPQVVNFELPNVPEDYVHRIGRTGRAGATGKAVSLVDAEESGYLQQIEKLTRQRIPVGQIAGFAPSAEAMARAATAEREADRALRQSMAKRSRHTAPNRGDSAPRPHPIRAPKSKA